jgi:hypothetical protein
MKATVVVRIANGCVTDVTSDTPGIVVEVHDYDVEGVEEDRLESDEEDEYYAKSVFET